MTTPRKIKCHGDKCLANNIKHYKKDMKQINGKNYCRPCYNRYYNEISDRDKLYKYVARHYGIKDATTLQKKHIKEFKLLGWSYKKQYAIFKYAFEIEKDTPNIKYGLKYLDRYQMDAIKYYNEKKKLKLKNKNKKNQSRIIYLDDSGFSTNKYKNSKFINMEDI